AGELSYQQGVRFDIPAGRRDTVTSVSVSFDNDTDPGVNTTVQLYRITGTSATGFNWTPVSGTSFFSKVLTAADVSPATGAPTYTTYVINRAAAGINPFILDSGSYAAIVKTLNADMNSEVVINAAIPIVDRYNIAGYYGQADTSDNISGFSFSPTGIATGTSGSVPLVRVNFGTLPTATNPGNSVGTIAGVTIGDAFPNPANSSLNVPVGVSTGAVVN